MASETFKKRQKEAARREKQKRKAARLMARRSERAGAGKQVQGENSNFTESVSESKPKTLG